METSDCPFCKKLAGELAPEEVVWQFPHSVAFLGMFQYYQGYCILISRTHARELNGLPETERRAFLDEMCLLARAIEDCFHPHKLNYELLGNQVPHLHWHLFARYADDPERLKPVWLAMNRAEHSSNEAQRLRQGKMERVKIRELLEQRLRELTAAHT